MLSFKPCRQGSGKIESRLKMPLDVKITDSLEKPRKFKTCRVAAGKKLVPKGWAIGDLGPQTIEEYLSFISQAKTVFWCGPLGLYEKKSLDVATNKIAEALANSKAKTVISGGDTVPAIKKVVDLNRISHVSLAGGATLSFLAGKKLPVLEFLKA